MDNLLVFIVTTLIYLLSLYSWIVLAAVILQLLINFNVINSYNSFVRSLNQALRAVTEPVFRRVRRFMPDTGAFDLSPVVVLILIWIAQNFLATVALPSLRGIG